MKNLLRKEWLLLLVLAAPFVYLGLVWPQIPERVPIHFNARFIADAWMEKSFGALMLPVSSILTIGIVRIWFWFDPKMRECNPETREQVGRVIRQCLTATALFFSALSIAIIWAAWGRIDAVIQTTLYGLPLVLMVLGNGMGKLRPNHTIGIRVPWTLNSAAAWNRTHRMAGLFLVGISFALIASAAMGMPHAMYFSMLLALLIFWALTSITYSYFLSRHLLEPAGPGGRTGG